MSRVRLHETNADDDEDDVECLIERSLPHSEALRRPGREDECFV